mmetsp:Transcript_4160/g.10735  ORF Transcript_4160/g.10735 Transcript_4160/m.10735 type:complete len:326 (-) Transcript_4160:240-1217(-)
MPHEPRAISPRSCVRDQRASPQKTCTVRVLPPAAAKSALASAAISASSPTRHTPPRAPPRRVGSMSAGGSAPSSACSSVIAVGCIWWHGPPMKCDTTRSLSSDWSARGTRSSSSSSSSSSTSMSSVSSGESSSALPPAISAAPTCARASPGAVPAPVAPGCGGGRSVLSGAATAAVARGESGDGAATLGAPTNACPARRRGGRNSCIACRRSTAGNRSSGIGRVRLTATMQSSPSLASPSSTSVMMYTPRVQCASDPICLCSALARIALAIIREVRGSHTMRQPTCNNPASSGPVKDAISSRREGGGGLNSSRQTLHTRWRTSSS